MARVLALTFGTLISATISFYMFQNVNLAKAMSSQAFSK
jgi:hypothetical protein